MSSNWSALHAQLLRQVNTLTFEHSYREVQRRCRQDLPPGDVSDLMQFLRDPAVDLGGKNSALKALVTEAQSGAAETTSTLLLLALWPGLDAARARIWRSYSGPATELAGDLVGRLTLEIGKLDLTRVTRIAATLLRNVERDLRRDLQRNDRQTPAARSVDELIDGLSLAPLFPVVSTLPAPDLAAFRNRLSGILGADLHLVLLVAVGGCSQREAAQHLGIQYETARKRFQRAIARLSACLDQCPDPGV